MPFPRIRLEVCVPRRIAIGSVGDRQRAAVEARGYAEPLPPVVRRDGAVATPAVDIRTLAGIGEADAAGLAARALQAEIEPLPELGVRVGADVHADFVRPVRGDGLDGAGVEAVADLEHEKVRC